jgi:branched-chain amino acid transport system ATP-binding protein
VALLDLSRVTMRFGGLVAVNELDLSIEPGQLYGLIGPNGAGKTTVFNVITGVRLPGGSSSKELRSSASAPEKSPAAASPERSKTSGCSAR